MARRRMIDPNFWQSEDVSKLSVFARLLFIGMFSNADDEGRGRANPNYLKSIIFPYDDIRPVDVDKALSEISHNTSVVLYEVAHNKYYAFTNWESWQRVDKPQQSHIPPFQEPVENESGISRELVESDYCLKEKKGKEEKINKYIVHFNEFWEQYPQKVNKQKAQALFEKLKVDDELLEKMLNALKWQKSEWEKQGNKYIPHPTTWINGRRWEDEKSKITEKGSNKAFPQREHDEQETLERDMKAYENMGEL